MTTKSPTPSKPATPARRAMVWSFFVPPMGVLMGWLALRKVEEGDEAERGEAVGAIANGAFGTAVLIAAIIFLPMLFRWAMNFAAF